MKFALEEVAGALDVAAGAEWGGRVAKGWSIDSRTIEADDVFFALRGPNHDGHRWVADVLRKGAAAAIVERGVELDILPSGYVDHAFDGAQRVLRVRDTLDALQRLATWARRRYHGRIIAVTGSAGKTTTKEMIAAMLAVAMKTAKNEGNLNNHIGLPLSLLRLDESSKAAVLEAGMNHAGEIRRLAEIARPDVGVVTNVGYAHMENFDSIDGVAAAKRELIEGLRENGTAVLNADDARVANFVKSHAGRVVLYGEAPSADIRAEKVVTTAEGTEFRVGTTKFSTPLTGRHNVSNILAGIAVAGVFDIAPERLTGVVAALRSGKMRGQRIDHNGITIFNDCYNSNPEAVRAMIDVLRASPARRRIAVLGEMLELGEVSAALHREMGEYAASKGIDVLIGIQGAAKEMVSAFGSRNGFYFDDSAEAGRSLRGVAQTGDAILFKGSRGVRVEHALEQFLAEETSAETGGGKA